MHSLTWVALFLVQGNKHSEGNRSGKGFWTIFICISSPSLHFLQKENLNETVRSIKVHYMWLKNVFCIFRTRSDLHGGVRELASLRKHQQWECVQQTRRRRWGHSDDGPAKWNPVSLERPGMTSSCLPEMHLISHSACGAAVCGGELILSNRRRYENRENILTSVHE